VEPGIGRRRPRQTARRHEGRREAARRKPVVPEHDRSLDDLRADADALADAEDRNGTRWAAHAALLDRLAALRRDAEASGWTSLAIERDGETARFRLFGASPGEALRTEVPDPSDDQTRGAER
jgi:hypothetical protein